MSAVYWEEIQARLKLRADGPCNLGSLAMKGNPTLRWNADGEVRTYSGEDLSRRACKFANMLLNFGVQRRDRVLFLTRHIPDLYWGVPGALLHGAAVGIVSPETLEKSGARLLVVEPEFKPAVDAVRKSLPDLWQIVILGENPGRMKAGDFLYEDYYGSAEETYVAAATGWDDPAIVQDGATWPHAVAVPLLASSRFASGFHPGQPEFLSYGMLAPFLAGACVEAGGNAEGRLPDGTWFCPELGTIVCEDGRPLPGVEGKVVDGRLSVRYEIEGYGKEWLVTSRNE